MARSHPRPKSIDVEPEAESIRRPRWLLIAIAALAVSATLALVSDWWACLPEEATATYVGRDACADCHQAASLCPGGPGGSRILALLGRSRSAGGGGDREPI